MTDFKKTTENAMNRYHQRLAANQFKKSGTQAITPAVSTLPKTEKKLELAEDKVSNKKENKGGFFGALGYLFHRGLLQSFQLTEDMFEGVARWGAQLVGKEEWAEKTKNSTWFDYDSAEKWYNPSDDNFAKNMFDFNDYVSKKFNEGLGKSVEGTADYLVGLGAEAVGEHKTAERLMLNDATNLYADKQYADAGKGTKFVGDVSQGIGNMLPSIALSFINPGLGKANFAISAAGQATSEKAQENGKLGFGEWGYGTTMGALEGAIEEASGGAGKYLGKATGKVFGKQIAKSTAGKLATNVIGEGLEEVASDLADPLVQKAFGVTDKDLGEMYSETKKGLPKTFAVGAVTGGVMGGASTAMQAKAVGGVKNLNAIENATAFNNALSENNVRQEKGKNPAYSQRYITNEQQRVSETLKKADDETRAKIFKQAPRLKLYFNNDGSVKGTQVQEKTAEPISPSGSFSTAPMRASIKTDEKGRQYVQADRKVISGDDPNVWKAQITKYINDVIRQGQDLQIKTVEGDTLTITANTAGKAAFHNENLSKSKFKTKLDAEAHIDELAKTSIARKNIDGTKKIIPDRENKHAKYSVAKDGWNYRNAYFKDSNDNLYKLTLSVAIDGTVESVYNIGLIKKASTNGESRLEPQRAADASTPIIRKSEKKVNTLEEKSLEKVSKQGYSASIKGRENDLLYTPASEVRSDIAETIKDVMLISDGSIDYVVTDDLGDSNGFYDPDSGIMYLSNNAEIEGLRSFVVGHEYTHSLEGTEEYTTLANAILKRISKDKELAKKYDIQDYAVRYVIDAEKSGKKYSKEQYKYIAQTELVADFVGKEMLSNEATVKRIGSRNKGFVSKLLQWVKDKISIFKSKKGTERDTLKFLLKAEKMLSNAIGASVGGFEITEIADGNNEDTSENNRYSLKTFNNDATVIDSNIKTVAGMKSIINLKGDEFPLSSGTIIDDVFAFYSTLNKTAYNDELGDVELTRRGVKDSFSHGIGDKKAAAFKAVPDIIREGRVVDYQENWKNRGYDTAVIAAPITISNDEYYALVVVRRTKTNQRFYLHEIDIKKRQAVLTEATTNKMSQELGGLPINSIFDKIRKVNTFEEKSLEKNVNIRKSLKITLEMADDERYKILKDKKITLTAKADNVKLNSVLSKIGRDGNNLYHKGVKLQDKIKLFRKIGEEFGIFKRYSNTDISLSFEYSRGAIKESANNQKNNYDSFAKMLTCFDSVIENAVGIEVHNRNKENYKPDITLKCVYVLVSAFEDGDGIVPVKLEVKEFIDKKNTLYVAIALESIKKDDIVTQGNTIDGVTQYAPSSIISILDLMRNVNPKDVNFTKYFPEKALTDEQRAELAKVDDKNTRKSLKDSAGKVLTQEQQEFFKDSKIRDEEGNLLVVYHGTNNEGFTVFDITKSNINNWYGEGFYFSDNRDEAKSFGQKLVRSYLNIKNPYMPTSDKILEDGKVEFAPSFKDDLKNRFNDAKNDKRLFPHTITEILKKNGYDGISLGGVYVAFYPEQIKLTSNLKPTDNVDIRYSLKTTPDYKLLDTYNEKQYNDFGWARVNGVLSKQENADFVSKYRLIKLGLQREVHKTANGEIIVAVNDGMGKTFGINNVLVYAKGSFENYKITKVVRLNLDNETELEIEREFIYEYEKNAQTQSRYALEDIYGEEDFQQYNREDFPDYRESKTRARRRTSGDISGEDNGNNQVEQDGRRNLVGNREDKGLNTRKSLKIEPDYKLLDTYDEKQYNAFGWARVNGVLSKQENADFVSKYRLIKLGLQREVHKTANGEIIVAVNDGTDNSFGINNVLVYAKGSFENYKITKVVRINLDNETALEYVRDFIYEICSNRRKQAYQESNSFEDIFDEGLIRSFVRESMPSYQENKTRARRRESGDISGEDNGNNQVEQDGRKNLVGNREDKGLNTRKSLKQIRYIPYYKIGYNNIEKIRREVWNLYSGIESGVADGIAINIDNSIYVLDTSKDDGEVRFAVRKVLIADDESLAMEVIRRINNDAISKRYISDGLSSRIRYEYDNGSRSSLQRESGEKLSDNQGQSKHNEVGISTENGVGRRLTVRKSLKIEPERYSYENLTKKNGIKVVELSTKVPLNSEGKIDKASIILQGRFNARKQGNKKNTATNTYVYVDDIGLDVLLSKSGMNHGIVRSEETTLAVMKIGDVLKNSIAVNELDGSDARKTEMSYVLLGVCKDSNNIYAVRSIVSKIKGEFVGIDIYQLGAIKSKKKKTPTSVLDGTAVTGQSPLISSESSTINIVDFLDYVKEIPLVNEVFSKDVAQKLGVSRSIGSLSPSIRYSVKSQAEMEADEISRKIIEEIKEEYHLSEDEIKPLRSTIYEEIRKQFASKNKSKGLYQHLYKEYKKMLIDEVKKTKYKTKILDSASDARDLIRRTYTSASILQNDELKDFLKTVSGFKRGAAIPLTVRDKVANLKAVYTKESLSFVKEETAVSNGESSSTISPVVSCYDPNIADAINLLSEKAGSTENLSLEELEALCIVSKGLIHLYKDFNAIWRGGEKLEVEATAKKGIETLKNSHDDNAKKSLWGKISSAAKMFIINNVDPFAVAQYIDGFDDAGQMTACINEIRVGETKAQLYEMDMLSNFDAFFKKNRKYHRRLKEKMKLSNGLELTYDQAMQIYLLSKREQANLYESGIVLKEQGIVKITEEDVKEISKNFIESDLEYVKIAHKVFNEDARLLKVETDEKLYGYSIVEDGNNYIPAYRDRDGLANVLGEVKDFFVDATATATNPSFNKKTKPGAKLPLRVNGLSEVIARHVHAVAIYSGLAIPIRSFNKIYNALVEGESMRKVANSLVWNGTYRYFNKVLLDMQGIMQKGADKILSYLRGTYAKFQLGFNLKSVLSQFASYPMAFTYLDFSVLSKGLFMRVDKEKMYKYAPSARIRVEDKTVIKAQSLSTKVNKLSDIFTKPMQKMDAFVVSRIWNACQLQIQKEKGYKIGTEENLKLAGELTEKVVNETQSNSKAGERSSMSRSQNALLSSLTLFTSDAQKQTSRLFVAIGKFKHAKNAQEKASARKLFAKTVTAITMSHLTYVLIAITMADLLGRLKDEDKDGEIVDDALKFGAKEFGAQFAGMLPIFRDLYSYFVDGFDMDNYAINMVNDTLSAAKAIGKLGSNVIKGKPMSRTEIARPLRQFIYAVGQLTGIPVRNIYNYIFGVINKFNPEVAYKTNSLFYNNTSWKRDMQEAYAVGNVSFANTIAKTEIINRADFDDDKVIAELARLSVEGYSVMPSGKVEKITVDNEEYTLTAEMQRLYAKTISGEEQAIKELISTAGYVKLSNDEKADAIEYLQTYFKHKAKNRVNKNSAIPTKYLLAEKIGLKNVAVYLSVIKSIVADKDVKGNIIKTRKEKVEEYVNSLKISAVEKYLLMLLAGYKLNQIGKDKVLPYIKSMTITNAEKKKLLEAVS